MYVRMQPHKTPQKSIRATHHAAFAAPKHVAPSNPLAAHHTPNAPSDATSAPSTALMCQKNPNPQYFPLFCMWLDSTWGLQKMRGMRGDA